jgi:hypothetical protein
MQESHKLTEYLDSSLQNTAGPDEYLSCSSSPVPGMHHAYATQGSILQQAMYL